jgi:hypothetical protein
LIIAAAGFDFSKDAWVHKTIFGLLLHDRGPFSDRHESGVDPELQFKPPAWPGLALEACGVHLFSFSFPPPARLKQCALFTYFQETVNGGLHLTSLSQCPR